MLAIRVITCSDRAFRGEYEDLSGKEIVRLLREYNADWVVERSLIPDDEHQLEEKLIQYSGQVDIILTSGGTGMGPRDITPEVTRRICERDLPGIAEMLRMKSLQETPFSVFSRGRAGLKNGTMIINLPGSLKAARFCTLQLVPILEHGVQMIRGGGH